MALLLPAVLLMTAILAACTSVPLPATIDLRTIRLAPIAEPLRYDLNVFAAPGMGMRIGAYDAVLARDIARPPVPGDKDAAFTAALADQAGLRLGAELAAALGETLAAAGIPLAAGSEAADATLAIEFLYAGYVEQPFRPFTPLVMVEIRLTAQDQGLLFRQRYTYGTMPYLHDDLHFVPEDRYTFKDEAALLGNATLAARGLRAAFPLIAADFRTKFRPSR
ncbi:hypothetical protein A8950_0599 [Dongia mobilis]|uniref:Lipoprotein n=2 Tax=Dongia mobilis TaxID=578943 RepID=A0A4R6WXA9_9PROT|nr:hypothetical protein A8950_0599 [Dongia mobilis]